MRIGLAGLGTVGATLAARLVGGSVDGVRLTHISARDKTRDRGFATDGLVWLDTPQALAAEADVDMVVELIGGADGAALELVEAALSAGKHVVTANKAMLAAHGVKLAGLAEQHGVSLAYEAAIAGGIPIVKTIREGLQGNQISKVSGILNGTCNYILTEMEEKKVGYAETLKEAQALGYAEADPTFDVEGVDAAQKLALLCGLAFGVEPDFDAIQLTGITGITGQDFDFAAGFNAVIRLVGLAEKSTAEKNDSATGIVQWVGPALVRQDRPLASIKGVTNAVQVDADMVGQIMMQGPGAGGGATASAVLADIIDIAQGRHIAVFGRPVATLTPSAGPSPMAPCEWYLRLSLVDAPGSMAKATSILAEHGVSIEEAVQRGPENSDSLRPVVFITHQSDLATIEKALSALQAVDVIAGELNFMPVL